MKKGFSMVVLLYLSLGVYAQVNTVDITFGQFLMHYFEGKNHSIVDNTISYFQDMKVIDNKKQGTFIAFYAELFKDEELKNEIIQGLDKTNNLEVITFFKFIANFNLDNYYIETKPNYNMNDMYWSSYFASGKVEYLKKLLDVGIQYHHEDKDMVLFLTGSSALWSLSSNSLQFPAVKNFLIESKNDGNVKTIDYIIDTDPQVIKNDMTAFLIKQREAKIWQ